MLITLFGWIFNLASHCADKGFPTDSDNARGTPNLPSCSLEKLCHDAMCMKWTR